MKKEGKINLIMIAGLVAFIVTTSCTTEDQLHSQTSSRVETTFALAAPSAMDGMISIHDAYLKLDAVQATGSLAGNNITDITQPVPAAEPPFQLSKSDSSKIRFTLPFRRYDQLDFHLLLFQDNYELVFQEIPSAEVPDPTDESESTDPAQPGQDDSNDEGNDGTDNGQADDKEDENSDDGENDQKDQDEEDRENNDSGDEDDEEKDDEKKDKDKKNKNKDDKGDDKNKGNDNDDDEEDNDGKSDEDEDDNDDEDDDNDDGRTGRTIVNLADFFQNAKPAMVLIGTYDNNGRAISMVFVATTIREIMIPARQGDSFSLTLDEENSAVITFNPEILFKDITTTDIESAQIQKYQQQDVLFIHPDFNAHLYNIIAPRLEQSADLNFRASSDL